MDTTRMSIRHDLFLLNKERLEQMAHRAVFDKNMNPSDFLVVCIHVDDPAWTELVDFLMPGQNWQQYRDRGEKPVARGSVSIDLREHIAEVVPRIKDALFAEPPDGYVLAASFDAGGASVYHVSFTQDKDMKKINVQ
ncbi:hypothetical protein ACFL08_04440 [Patescibacteria group bacterium]